MNANNLHTELQTGYGQYCSATIDMDDLLMFVEGVTGLMTARGRLESVSVGLDSHFHESLTMTARVVDGICKVAIVEAPDGDFGKMVYTWVYGAVMGFLEATLTDWEVVYPLKMGGVCG